MIIHLLFLIIIFVADRSSQMPRIMALCTQSFCSTVYICQPPRPCINLVNLFPKPESSINSNHWKYELKWFFLSFYFSESCHLSEYTLKRFGGLFDARPRSFPAFQKSLKFGFLVALLTSLFGFSVWFFKVEFNLLPDLLNTGFKIIRLLVWWRTLWSENIQIPDFSLTRYPCLLIWGTSCLPACGNFSKTGQVLSSNPSLKYSFFSKHCWWILEQGILLNFFYSLSVIV